MLMPRLTYHEHIQARQSMRLVQPTDLDIITQIEHDSYPIDEKATYEKIAMRSQVATNYFYVLLSTTTREIIGYVNGTCIEQNYITHSSMSSHNPVGTTLVLHSVTIKSDHRNHGLATLMLKAYLEFMKAELQINLILLLCKANLCRFYTKCGFKMVGVSSVVHGQDPWFEMSFDVARSRLLSQYQIDAFTSEGFRGNPAGVVLGMRSTEWMQKMGMENNLAETSFIQPVLSSEGPKNTATFDLRWFTPTIEVRLCGHATLAAAHVLFEYSYLNTPTTPADEIVDTICFNTLYRGQLRAKKLIEDGVSFIELDFPSQSPLPHELSEQDLSSVTRGLRISPEAILFAGKSIDDLFIVVSPEHFVQIPTLASGLLGISELSSLEARGLIVTCVGPNSSSNSPSDLELYSKADFISRFFAPRAGINEDPVTGSAHTVLAPYWCEKLGKNQLMGYQYSQRGGWVRVRQDNDRIYLTGQCVSVLESTILVNE